MPAVDTNVVVRLITRDDEGQFRLAEEFVEKGAWISTLVLMETLWVLDAVYSLPASRIAVAVEMLLEHRCLMLQDPELVAAALATFRKKPAPGFPDCLMLETARRAGQLPLATFDRALGTMEGARLLASKSA